MSEWSAEPLPEETVSIVRAELGSLVDKVVTAVQAGSPVYGEVLAAPEGMALRLGIEQAIRSFLNAAERGERPAGETDELWRALGEAEFQSGRRLDDLRAAFRIGIRAAWRGAADLAIRAGVSAPVAIALAEAIFVYGDELASDVVEGYLRIESDQAGERQRRRRRLAAALLDPAGQDPDVVARASELAQWPLPRTLAVAALEGDGPAAVARRLDADVLAGADADGAWLVIPDPDGPGRAPALDRALADQPAAVGPTVEPADAARSLRWARLALGLHREGVLSATGPLRTSDHLATLILLQDRDMALALAGDRLAPLDGLPAGERERLLQTLGAWLSHQSHTPQVAAELHVHPQTVRYRLAKLRELLGDRLDSTAGRFELELALRIAAALAR
ncbi:MAG TPA: helix-turn-helix domain-containing protein [Solirubrobacteraceae bacterium]|nr:helix-turn-helix domain-containing protein [Solirubrobacteraceae bacterium]